MVFPANIIASCRIQCSQGWEYHILQDYGIPCKHYRLLQDIMFPGMGISYPAGLWYSLQTLSSPAGYNVPRDGNIISCRIMVFPANIIVSCRIQCSQGWEYYILQDYG